MEDTRSNKSKAHLLSSLKPETRHKILARLSEDQRQALLYSWEFWGRENQQEPPVDWFIWCIMAGRGWGKTRTGAELVHKKVNSGEWGRVALVARTAADTRDVMVEGDSGLLETAKPGQTPIYEPSKRRVTWPNGAIGITYSSEKPSLLRGPQFDGAWCDELSTWRYRETWDNLIFGLRRGENPQVVVTFTPKPIDLVKEVLSDPATFITRGSTFDNKGNLAARTLENYQKKYGNTRIGLQELYAHLLTDTPGALWLTDQIAALRVTQLPRLVKTVVAVDPQASHAEGSAETGIIVRARGVNGDLYTLADYTISGTPAEWGRAVVAAFNGHNADEIVAEVNQGGDMVEAVIRNTPGGEYLPIKLVRATRGKEVRAQPISALTEQGRDHMLGYFGDLESQLTTWVPGQGQKSPDRLDAYVWGGTRLIDPDAIERPVGQSNYIEVPARPGPAGRRW